MGMAAGREQFLQEAEQKSFLIDRPNVGCLHART